MSKQKSTKTCTKCGQTKPIDQFKQRSGRPLGQRISLCRECNNKYHREHQRALGDDRLYARRKRKDPDYFRRNKLKNLYGITVEEFWAMHERQQGLCAMCGKPETRKHKGGVMLLAIDHCHATGRVRGLLCHRCNVGLGYVEKEDWHEKALAYLEAHRKSQ